MHAPRASLVASSRRVTRSSRRSRLFLLAVVLVGSVLTLLCGSLAVRPRLGHSRHGGLVVTELPRPLPSTAVFLSCGEGLTAEENLQAWNDVALRRTVSVATCQRCASPSAKYPALQWLPVPVDNTFLPRLDEALSSPDEQEEVWPRASPAGFVDQLLAVATDASITTSSEYLLLVSSMVAMPSSLAAQDAILDELVAAMQSTPAPAAVSATLVDGDLDHILHRGFRYAEATGGLSTLVPVMAGASLGHRGVGQAASIDSPHAQMTLFSRAAVVNSCLEARARWRDEHRSQRFSFAHLPVPLRADLALASLNLGGSTAVVASPAMVITSGTEVGRYRKLLADVGRGGPDIKPSTLDSTVYSGLDALLPRLVSAAPSAWAASRALRVPALTNTTVYWDPYCGCTGINVEAINFLTGLEAKVQTRAVANPDCWCQGFPAADQQSLGRMMKPKVGSGDEDYGDQLPQQVFPGGLVHPHASVWITHKPVDALPHFPYSGAVHFKHRPTYGIARTMIEIDRITSDWVRRLNTDPALDEVWVPAQFLVDAFYRSGVRASLPIRVIPEPIDTDLYDPSAAEPLPALTKPTSRCHDRFKFLSNFKWEHRKGWDVLLRAYFGSFAKADRVCLVLKTYLYMTSNPYDERAIRERVLDFVKRELPHLDTNDLPPFEVLAAELPAAEMPRLYRGVDAFVLPTRGEGWGLPFQEAMAMGLPTIGTDWGGNRDFMNRDNSFLIDVEGLAPPDGIIGGFRGRGRSKDGKGLLPTEKPGGGRVARRNDDPRCAQPSLSSLSQHMQFVVSHQREAAEVGRRAREHIVRYFTRAAVARRVTDRLEELQPELQHRLSKQPTTRRKRGAAPRQFPPLPGDDPNRENNEDFQQQAFQDREGAEGQGGADEDIAGGVEA